MSTTSTQNSGSAVTSQIMTLPPIPELFDPNFLDILLPQVPETASTQHVRKGAVEAPPNAMMDALRSTAHQKLTDNDAPAFSSTLEATLDAFAFLGTYLSGPTFDSYLQSAWAEDPNLTLRIIWNTRSIHDGKSDKQLFYRAFGWLFENHPRTAIVNLHCLVDPVCLRSNKDGKKKKREGVPHGYWKDLLNILALATLDELRIPPERGPNFLCNYCDGRSLPAFNNNQEQEEWARAKRIKWFRNAYKRLTQKLLDKRYRALYIAIARLFADELARGSDVADKIAALPIDASRQDRMALMRELTLAVKWAPTPSGSHDRVTNISSAICLLLYDAQVHYLIARISPSVATGLSAVDIHQLRCAYQKHILTPGRRYCCVAEPLMSSNRWSEIVYSRVPSICMNKNKDKFFKHDQERFRKYIEDVESGKIRISGATLLPHLLAMESHKLYSQNPRSEMARQLMEVEMRVVDAQWAALVERLREAGQLDNCIAVCDVSGSMGSLHWYTLPSTRIGSAFTVEPIWPALSLSLLVARLAKPPFKDVFITFSESPQFVTIDPEEHRVPLGATITHMNRAHWGFNTDFEAVFLKLILPLAIKHQVPKDQMIKRIFVFSDMEFDAANAGKAARSGRYTDRLSQADPWKTSHDVVAEAYAEAGYDVPEIVYWDMSMDRDGTATTPVTGEKEGVALLSGYSPSLLKLFVDVDKEGEEGWEVLDKKGEARSEMQPMTPMDHMKKALGRDSYNGLVVVD